MSKILIVDFSEYKNTLADIFKSNGYDITISDSAFEAMSKLKAFDYDLVVSEVELPGDNAFDLYNYIHTNYPYIPTIMTTNKNIDTFFNKMFEEGIGNVLHKPVKTDELLNLTQKLITKKNIFGLKNYINNIIEEKKIRINSSKHIQKAIHLIIEEVTRWGFKIENKVLLNLVLNEMTINAVYHSHGLTKEKESRIPVELPKDQFVDIFFCRNENSFGIAINDYNGKLSKLKILDSINKIVEQSNLIEKAFESGEDISDLISETGRGFDLVRKLTGEYYFIIKENFRTEIIFIFDATGKQSNNDDFSSLKIIEDIDH